MPTTASYIYTMVVGTKKYSNLDFVPTISDSEDDVPILDSSDDEKVEAKKTTKKRKGKNNKKKVSEGITSMRMFMRTWTRGLSLIWTPMIPLRTSKAGTF